MPAGHVSSTAHKPTPISITPLLVPSLSALEELSGMEVLCSDKTGTLTLNKLTLDKEDVEVGGWCPVACWVG